MYRDTVTDTGYRLITPDGKVANRLYSLGFNSEKYGLLQTTGYKYCNLLSSHTGSLVFSPDEEQYIENHQCFVGIIRNAELEKVLDRYVRDKDESMAVDVANFVFGTVESKYGKITGPSRIFVYSPISGKKWSAVIDYSGDDDAMSKIARLLRYYFHWN